MLTDSKEGPGAGQLSDRINHFIKGRGFSLVSAAIILTTLGFMFAASPANRELKIGYVNSSTILGLLPGAQAAQASLDTLVQEWSDTLDQMSQEYQTKVSDYSKQTDMMTPQAKEAAQNAIATLQQRIASYRQAKVGTGGELDQKREELLKPIRARIYNAIALVAKEQGMQFVFDKNNQVAQLLYADPYYDITYKVLDVLTR